MKKIRVEKDYYDYLCRKLDEYDEYKKENGIKSYSILLNTKYEASATLVANGYKINGNFIEFYDNKNDIIAIVNVHKVISIKIINS